VVTNNKLFLEEKILRNMSSSIIASTESTTVKVCVDFSKDHIPVAREATLAGVDSVPILIHLDFVLDGAPIHIIAVAGAENLDMPFDMVYQLKDDSEKLMSTFRDRLRVKIGLLPENELFSIPFKDGADMASCFCLPSVLKQFCVIHKQLTVSASAAASEKMIELLREASPEQRASLKGKRKRVQKKDPNPDFGKAAKIKKTSAPKSIQTILKLGYSVPDQPEAPVVSLPPVPDVLSAQQLPESEEHLGNSSAEVFFFRCIDLV